MSRAVSSAPSSPYGLELKNVRKTFGAIEVLRDINLIVGEGEFVVFVGPSGCGKSTLLRMIAGLEDVTDGEIEIAGRDVTDAEPSVRGIAMVFQTYALYPHLNVRDNMGFSLKMAGRPRAEVASKVLAAAEILHLTPLLDRRPAQLSGGQRQRVSIGRAIVRNPKVFLFDEPLSNLDAELRIEMRIEIAKLHRRLGNTMIYVTHDQTEAMTLADRIVVLRGGRIEQIGSPAHIYDDPDNLFVACFIGAPKMNVLPARISAGQMDIDGCIMAAPEGFAARHGDGDVSVGIRPHCLRPVAEGEAGLIVQPDFVEYLGDKSYVYGHTPSGHLIVADAAAKTPSTTGQTLRLGLGAKDMFIFDRDGRRLR